MGVSQHVFTTHFRPGSQSLLEKHAGEVAQVWGPAQKPVPSVVSSHEHSGLSWQVTVIPSPPGQIEAQRHSPSVSGVPGQPPPWHIPPTHSSPSAQRWKHSPQWRSFLSRFTHLSPQRLWTSGQAQTLSSPRLMHLLEQHWESLLHSLPKRLQSSSAQATPGKEAKAAPRRAPPIHLIALPLERCLLQAPWQARLRNSVSFVWPSAAPSQK
jgi:hypothetical protein